MGRALNSYKAVDVPPPAFWSSRACPALGGPLPAMPDVGDGLQVNTWDALLSWFRQG